jgi:hypothetical protein
MKTHRTIIASLALVLVVAATSSARASSTASELTPQSLRHAQTIRAELDVRYRVPRRGGLAVTEASSTGVVESFTLVTSDLLETRVVPAENGIYYAVCPARASCPYPARRHARTAADVGARRLALELAVRTFLETTVDVVAVSLPTLRFMVFIVERHELVDEVDLAVVAQALEHEPSQRLSASVHAVVDRVTRPRIYVAVGLEPTLSGRDTWLGLPRWPV